MGKVVYRKQEKEMKRPISPQKKYRYTVAFRMCLILVLADLLQNTPYVFPPIFGARAFLIIPAVVIISIFERNITATYYGILAGVLWDISSGTFDGMNTLLCMLTATAVCVLMHYVMRNNIVSALLLSAVGILLYMVLHWLFFIVAQGVNDPVSTLLRFYLPSALYTFAFSPIYYYRVKSLRKNIRARYPRKNLLLGIY